MSSEKEEPEGSVRKKIKLEEHIEELFPKAERLDVDKIYPKICEYYNEIADKREDDWSDFKKTTTHIVKVIDEITKLKLEKPDNWEELVADKRSEVALSVIYMKKLNRCEKLRIKSSREATQEKKQQTESLYLELQNLLCDIDHISNEVDKCLELRNNMNFGIDLIPIDEFYKEAPPEVSKVDITKSDEHELQLARLEYELKQRKDKATLCEQLEVKRKDVLNDIKNTETTLESLKPLVNDLVKAAKPLSEKLDIKTNSAESVEKLNVLSLLPDRLYFLYVQADAYREACDKKLLLSITGNIEAAKKFKPDSLRLVESHEHDGNVSLEEKRKKYMTKHPLSVVLKIVLKDRNCILLSFHYLVYMKILSVTPRVILTSPISASAATSLLKDRTILNELFPGDTGTVSPNPANYYQLKKLGCDKLETDKTGLVYKWVQKLAGLEFVRSPRKGDRSIQLTQATIPVVIRNIRQRLTSRLTLASQIISFESGHVSVPASMANIKLTLCLKLWLPISYKEFISRPFTNFLISSASESSGPAVAPSDFFYRAIIKKPPAIIEALIVIKPNYPNSSPIFVFQVLLNHQKLNSRNNAQIRELEFGVNIYWEELLAKNRSPLYLLSALLHKALVDWELFFSTQYPQLFPHPDQSLIQYAKEREESRKLFNRGEPMVQD